MLGEDGVKYEDEGIQGFVGLRGFWCWLRVV